MKTWDKSWRVGISSSVLKQRNSIKPLDGIGVYTQSLLNEFDKLGVATTRYAYPPVEVGGLDTSLPASFRSMALRGLLPFRRQTSMSVDVFHVTDYRAVPMSCPVVTTLYDAIPFVAPEMANSRLRELKNFILRRSAQYADHVIAISNFSTQELIEHYRIPADKISVVYCGVDDSWLVQPASEYVDEVLSKYQLGRGYFLSVGTIQPRKNIGRAIQAHSLLSDQQRKAHPLLIVGKRGWQCDDLIVEIQKKVVKGEARWLENVNSRQELQCLYAGAEAFVFPSLYEGFGLPILEAFAMGLPVLTSNRTSLPEVSNGIGFEIDPLNIQEMAEVMGHLINLPDRVARVQAGRLRARELSWSRCASETLKVYQKVL